MKTPKIKPNDSLMKKNKKLKKPLKPKKENKSFAWNETIQKLFKLEKGD